MLVCVMKCLVPVWYWMDDHHRMFMIHVSGWMMIRTEWDRNSIEVSMHSSNKMERQFNLTFNLSTSSSKSLFNCKSSSLCNTHHHQHLLQYPSNSTAMTTHQILIFTALLVVTIGLILEMPLLRLSFLVCFFGSLFFIISLDGCDFKRHSIGIWHDDDRLSGYPVVSFSSPYLPNHLVPSISILWLCFQVGKNQSRLYTLMTRLSWGPFWMVDFTKQAEQELHSRNIPILWPYARPFYV